MLRRLAAFLALFALGSVPAGAATKYPSLSKRPAESRDNAPVAPKPVDVAPADAVLAGQVDELARQAQSGDTAFQQQIVAGRSAVSAANGAAPTSEPWVKAQMAITTLDSARYDSVAALAGLDSLYIGKQDGGDGARVAADIATIDPVRTRALAMVDAQNDALDGLRKGLKQP